MTPLLVFAAAVAVVVVLQSLPTASLEILSTCMTALQFRQGDFFVLRLIQIRKADYLLLLFVVLCTNFRTACSAENI